MPDPVQAVGEAAQTAATGGMGGALTAIVAFLGATKMFARTDDVERVKIESQKEIAELKADIAEKYLAKEAMGPLTEDIRHIRERVDQLADRR